MSDRFFFNGPLAPGDVTLVGPEAHHLTAVRRFVVGDRVVLFNGDGHEYPAQVTGIEKKRVTLNIEKVDSAARELGFALHIAAALPKGDRGDFLIEKLTELGVTDFTPVMTDRGIVKSSDTKADKLRRAVIEASKQCGRNVLMRVHSPARWLDWCQVQTGSRLIAHPQGEMGTRYPKSGGIIVAIGPEGGFTDVEVQTAQSAGWQLLYLGPRILRAETAAVAAAAILGRIADS